MEKTYLDASADGLQLATAVIKPSGRTTGVLQVAHGMCDHKERYYPFMQYMAQHGYVCVVHDHRGHGESVKSPTDLGYMYSGGWRAMVDDLHIVNQWIHRQYSTLPIFLLGHSMGSMVARSYAKRYDSTIDTLIVCGSPSRNPAVGLARLLARLCTLLAGGHSRPQLLQRLTFGTFNRPFRHEGYPQHGCAAMQPHSRPTTPTRCAHSPSRPTALKTSLPSCKTATRPGAGQWPTPPCPSISSREPSTPAA